MNWRNKHVMYTQPPPSPLMDGRLEWTSYVGSARIVLDWRAFDFHADIAPDGLTDIAGLVMQMAERGVEPLDEEECEPELLEDGFTRIYFTPIVPMDYEPLIPEPQVPRPRFENFMPIVTIGTGVMVAVAMLAEHVVSFLPALYGDGTAMGL